MAFPRLSQGLSGSSLSPLIEADAEAVPLRIRLLRDYGFEVTDLIEVRPAEGSATRNPFVTLDWARRWPCEEVWKARKSA